jgi:Na+:H+ antiporter, NhaA family
MSVFIASVAFPEAGDYAAAKIAIFLASLIAGGLGVLVLWKKPEVNVS